MSDRRTCENCDRFGSCPTMREQHSDEVCEDHRKCPLPRIGSKEWGWIWSKKPLGNASSDKATYSVRVSEFTPPTVFDSKGNFAASCRDVHIAKRIAEMLTRRDWYKENRGKAK